MATPGIGPYVPAEPARPSTTASEARLSRPGGSRGEALQRLATNLEADAQNRVTKLQKKSFRLPSGGALKHICKNARDSIGSIACGLLKSSQPKDIPLPPNRAASESAEGNRSAATVNSNRADAELSAVAKDLYPPELARARHFGLRTIREDVEEGRGEIHSASGSRSSPQQSPRPDSSRRPSEANFNPNALYWLLKEERLKEIDKVSVQSLAPDSTRKSPKPLTSVKLPSGKSLKQLGRKTLDSLGKVFHGLQKQQVKNSNVRNHDWLVHLDRFGLKTAANQHDVGVVFNNLRQVLGAYQSQVDTETYAKTTDSLAEFEKSMRWSMVQTETATLNVKLLHAFGLQDASKKKDVDAIFDKVKAFLEKEGASGQRYFDQLTDMKKRMTLPELTAKPSNDSPGVAVNYVKKICAKKKEPLPGTLLDRYGTMQMEKGRFDKRETGLAQTIIETDSNQLIKLHNSVPLAGSGKTPDAVQEYTKNLKADSTQAGKVTVHSVKPGTEKVQLGRGSYGLVRIGENISTGELCAVKKIANLKASQRELAEAQKLREKIDPDVLRRDFLFSDGALERKDGQKTYITMPLAEKGDGLSDLNGLLGLRRDNKFFIDRHFNFTHRWLELGNTLQQQGLVHTDFKPGNIIGGRIADIDGIMYGPGKISTLTNAYRPPEVSSFNIIEQEVFDKFNSFSLGIMLMESITRDYGPGLPRKGEGRRWVYAQGYLDTNPEEKSRFGTPYTPYEKGVIQIAKQLAADDPVKRITAAEALRLLEDLKQQYYREDLGSSGDSSSISP